MIVRIQFVVPLCSVIGYITTVNGLYLNFAAPKNKALENLQNDPENYSPNTFDKWFRKGRHHYKKLVILDRKNKRVDDFVKKLISVIKLNDGDRLLNEDIRKMNCRQVSFGSIYNAKAKRKRCRKLHAAYKRRQPWINFVIPIPVNGRNIFADAAREGFASDYLMDFNRRDIDFDYFNTVHRAHIDKSKRNDKGDRKKQTEVIVNSNGEIIGAPQSRRDHTRFKVVPNEHSSEESNGKRTIDKNPMPSDNSDAENTGDSDNTDDENDQKSKKSDSNSDDENYESGSKRPRIKKIKDEWNDIMNMPDTVSGSSEERSPPKKERNTKTYESNSSENEDNDSNVSSEFKPHNKYDEDGGDNEKYVYMQGHRLYNVKDSRRMRNKKYFLPKRSIWSENTIQHLGSYWNSHEITGVHVN